MINSMQLVVRRLVCHNHFYSMQEPQRGAQVLLQKCVSQTLRLFLTTGSDCLQQQSDTKVEGDPGAKLKKTKSIPKITLIGQNQSFSVTTLEEARKLAKRRELKLIQIDGLNSKTGRVTYKLVTSAEMLKHELEDNQNVFTADKDKSNNQKKSGKSLTIGVRISEHDLASRLRNIAKWLAKHHEIRILIQGDAEDQNFERIVRVIEQSIKEPTIIGKIVQKRSKGLVTKFSILPVTGPSNIT